jgi:hypothetical protein
MRLLIALFGVGILLTQSGCIGEPLEELGFITTQIDSIRVGDNFGAAVIYAQLTSTLPNDDKIVGYGVKWSRQVNADESALAGSVETKRVEGIVNPSFAVSIPDLALDSIYFFQTYAQHKEGQTILSRVVQFRLGVSLSIEEHQQKNDTLLLRARINGLRNSGPIANLREFGVLLEEEKPGGNKINHLIALEQARDGLFTVMIDSVQFNQKYLASLYIKSDNKTWPSLKYNLKTTGGWRRLVDLKHPNYGSASISMSSASAFIGFGYPENCEPNGTTAVSTFNLSSNILTYLPTSISFPPIYSVAWKINDRIFCGFGEYTGGQFNCNPNARCSVFEYNVSTAQFIESAFDACDSLKPRSRAAAFTIKGKGYVGLGVRFSGTRSVYLNDFWEFDPMGKGGEGSFRSIKPLPVKENFGFDNAGRQFPIVFQFEDRVFVGGGSLGSIYLNDIWEFIPPKNDSDKGDWRFAGFFPGLPRDEMVCLTINKKGYLLLGYHNTLGEQADVWEFDPYTSSSNQVWKKLPDFPGESRASPIAFVVGDQFFIGGGKGTRRKGNQLTPSFPVDFWQFVPSN